jgi:lipoate-protein ligase B
MSAANELRLTWLYEPGRLPYRQAWALQHTLVEKRIAREIPDTLLLLEHEPVITLGRRADPANILADDAALQAAGVEVVSVERGGDVTYHGPGQLVGYPIMHLPGLGMGASDFMHALEEALMQALSGYGLTTQRGPGVIGVWVGDNKIAALGLRIRRGVTFHGFALNVAPNMAHWDLIVPCGIRDGGVTSLAAELGQAPDLAAVRARVAATLAAVLGITLQPATASDLRAAGVDVTLL